MHPMISDQQTADPSSPPPLAPPLHVCSQISIMTLRLFEQLIQKPNQHILHSLALRSLDERNYLENKPQEEREPLENGQPHDAV